MAGAIERGVWAERSLGAAGRWLVLCVVGACMLADLATFLVGEDRAVAPPERLFGFALAVSVVLVVWRPSASAVLLMVLLPVSQIADAELMLRLALPFVVGLVVATCGRALVTIFVVVTVGWFVGVEAASGDPDYLALVFALVVGTCSGLLGLAARRTGEREEALSRTVLKQERTIAEVRRLEQERIADELHDGIARQLTTIAIQVKVLGRTDDTALREVSQTAIAESATRALADVRRVLQLSGGQGQETESRSVDDWDATLLEVVGNLRAQGYDVVADGVSAPALPRVVASTLVRILREAAHNVRTHQPSSPRVTIQVEYSSDVVELSIVNDPPVATKAVPEYGALVGGYGLVRLTERVRALGGQLTAGPTDAGGWSVRASVPIG